MEHLIKERSQDKCEVCQSTENLSFYIVPPKLGDALDEKVQICSQCKEGIENPESISDVNHWRCLNDSMWSEVEGVKVIAYRMLSELKNKGEGWAMDLLDMMYLEDETLKWAKEGLSENKIVHKDSNGAILEQGDTVTLIKDLKVKGGGFTAKRGTAVRNINLVHDNPEHIEGKVEGQKIVILTQYVKK